MRRISNKIAFEKTNKGLLEMPADQIQYSEKYYDDIYEYRHVILPEDITPLVPKSHLMTETEWRNLGIQQSPGWVHYMMHGPEPHVILFRRPRTNNTQEPTQQQATLGTLNDQASCICPNH